VLAADAKLLMDEENGKIKEILVAALKDTFASTKRRISTISSSRPTRRTIAPSPCSSTPKDPGSTGRRLDSTSRSPTTA
jgi:hypothetical protein